MLLKSCNEIILSQNDTVLKTIKRILFHVCDVHLAVKILLTRIFKQPRFLID